MNKYVQEVMDSTSGLPKTFEEYQMMNPYTARRVPMGHIQKLREEFDKKRDNSGGSTMKPIVF